MFWETVGQLVRVELYPDEKSFSPYLFNELALENLTQIFFKYLSKPGGVLTHLLLQKHIQSCYRCHAS